LCIVHAEYFQNDAVIECFTKENFVVNEINTKDCQFYACDWKTLQHKLADQKFDVILTSETIYNEKNYESLHDVIDALLIPDGLVLLAAKLYYFGVGGNIPSFLEYLKTRGTFDSYECWSSDSDVPRKIVQLTRTFRS
uniref:Methyltranfer_dom domain-containing protein n=1 Tax=Gongylonema pulchrum TaxID=637853 RepID=A0A183D8J0_9BILA